MLYLIMLCCIYLYAVLFQIWLLLFVLLYVSSYATICAFRRKAERDDYFSGMNIEIDQYPVLLEFNMCVCLDPRVIYKLFAGLQRVYIIYYYITVLDPKECI